MLTARQRCKLRCFCAPMLCSSSCLSIYSPFALNFIQTGRISVYLSMLCIFARTLFTVFEVKLSFIILKYVRNRQTKTRPYNKTN